MVAVLMVCMNVALTVASGMPDTETWTSKDIGKVTTAGTATLNPEAMIWTVRGEGPDIWGSEDGFQYVGRPFRGDGFILARVESVSKTASWAKCGIMIRESTDPASRFVAVYATPDEGVRFQARTGTGCMPTSDALLVTKEQKAVKPPVWIKLERQGNRYYAYYATDKAAKAWTRIVWRPQAMDMPKTISAGLAVCSLKPGVLCEARFGSVVVSDAGYEIANIDVLANPKEARVNAYQTLARLGNWRDDSETIKKQGNLIAGSLFTITRTRELNGELANAVLPDYYRMMDLFPDCTSMVDALARIVILDGAKGLEYATKRLASRSPEDKDKFYEALIKEIGRQTGTAEGDAVIASFVEYVAKNSRFTLLEKVVEDLESGAYSLPMYISLLEAALAQPENLQTAIVGLRCMVVKMRQGPKTNHLQDLLEWVVTQCKETKLRSLALAALADLRYEQGAYVEAIEVFQPGLFSGAQPESQIVESLESMIASYRANTLLQATIQPERIYKAVGEKAGQSARYVVALHCQRKIAELSGLSLDAFAQAAPKEVKHSESDPENETWFWKGLVAAGEGDLGAAVAAYERFLAKDSKSILAARAYYDIALAKMAVGENAKEWITKAKALSPCDAVIRLEQRLNTTISARG